MNYSKYRYLQEKMNYYSINTSMWNTNFIRNKKMILNTIVMLCIVLGCLVFGNSAGLLRKCHAVQSQIVLDVCIHLRFIIFNLEGDNFNNFFEEKSQELYSLRWDDVGGESHNESEILE